jgi:uncharacterized delta-60 repeat protein
MPLPKVIPVARSIATPGRLCLAFVLTWWMLAAVAAPGELDTTFGPTGSGKSFLHLGPSDDIIADSVLDGMGRRVVVGTTAHDQPLKRRMFIARYNLDGTLDGGFGPAGGGRTVLNQMSRTIGATVTDYPTEGLRITIDSAGDIVAIGNLHDGYRTLVVAKLDGASGAFKSSFNPSGTFGAGIQTFDTGGDMLIAAVATAPTTTAGISQNGIVAVYSTLVSGQFNLGMQGFLADGTSSFTTLASFGVSDILVGAAVFSAANQLLIASRRINVGAESVVVHRYNFTTAAPNQDSTFNGTGENNLTGLDHVNRIFLDGNGKIVLLGWLDSLASTGDCTTGGPYTSALKVARLNAAGSTDTAFGTSGIATYAPATFTEASDIAEDAGSYLVTAKVFPGTNCSSAPPASAHLIRLTSVGALDSTLNSPTGLVDLSTASPTTTAALVEVTGATYTVTSMSPNGKASTSLRYTNAGLPDVSFDPIAASSIRQVPLRMGDFGGYRAMARGSTGDFHLGRDRQEVLSLSAAGIESFAFLANAYTTTPSEEVTAVAMVEAPFPTGRTYAARIGTTPSTNFTVSRYVIADGTLDTGWGGTGNVVLAVPGGNVLEVASFLVDGATGGLTVLANYVNLGAKRCAVWRLDASGAVLTGPVDIAIGGADTTCRGLTPDAGGNLLIGFQGYNSVTLQQDLGALRLTSALAPDTTFNATGHAFAGFSNSPNEVAGVVIDGGGKIVIGGAANASFIAARFAAAGLLDSTFGKGGRGTVTTDASNPLLGVAGIALQNNGRIVIGGHVAEVGGSTTEPTPAGGPGKRAGRLYPKGGPGTYYGYALVTFSPDGFGDPLFRSNAGNIPGLAVYTVGKATGSLKARSFLLQPDNKAVIAGYCNTFGGTHCAVRAELIDKVLRVERTGTGFGNVIDDSLALDCGQTACLAGYASGTPVTLLAQEDTDNSVFVSWSGCDFTGPTANACNVVLSSDRTVTATFNAKPPLSPIGGVAAVSAGGFHTCARTGAGGAKCWGYNDEGQVGDNSTLSRNLPVDVLSAMAGPPLSAVSQVASGGFHTCALLTGGAVSCWGSGWPGTLGQGPGDTGAKSVPVAVKDSTGLAPLTGALDISSGEHSSCARLASGELHCWGSNYAGTLGRGSPGSFPDPRLTGPVRNPTNTANLTGVTLHAIGELHACAVAGGTLYCWGENANGQLGDGTTTSSPLPVIVSGVPSVSALALGESHSCALTSAGEVYCWGANDSGQLGNNNLVFASPTPAQVAGLFGDTVAIAAGGDNTCALRAGGSVYCWGANYSGQIGNNLGYIGITDPVAEPTEMIGITGATAISVGAEHVCALVTGGQLRCAGWNGDGTLGDGTFNGGSLSSRELPVYTLTGAAATATQLAFPATPTGAVVGAPFNVTVQARDAGGTPTNVATNTAVQLGLAAGATGMLSGTLSCTINAGSNSCTVMGVIYSKSETISLTATRTAGDALTAATSGAFLVLKASPALTLTGPGSVTYSPSVPFNINASLATGFNMTGAVSVTRNLPMAGTPSGSGAVSGTGTTASTSIAQTGLPVGVYTFNATYGGDGNNNAATAGTPVIVNITKASQTLTFNPPASLAAGSGGFTLSATSPATGPVTFGLGTVSPVGACTLTGSTLTPVSVGSCQVSAAHMGDTNYLASPVETRTITINAAPTTATLSVSKSGTGSGRVAGTPIDCGSTCSATVSLGDGVLLTATPDAGSVFFGWTGACALSGVMPTCALTGISADTAVGAIFNRTTSTLTVSRAGGGSGRVASSASMPAIDCGTTCSRDYPTTAMVTLTASADVGSVFTGWSGGNCDGVAACTVAMTRDVAVSATFIPVSPIPLFTLSLSNAGNGAGAIESVGVNPQIRCPGTCSGQYPAGTVVTLVATVGTGTQPLPDDADLPSRWLAGKAATSSSFAGWSGVCSGTGACSFVMTGNVSVGATFTAPPAAGTTPSFALNVNRTGSGSGTVTSTGAAPALNCGATCGGVYASGSMVTLTASAAAGSTFTGWSGACSGTAPCTLTVSAATTVGATFALDAPVTVSAARTGSGSGSVISAPGGIVCGSTCGAGFASGSRVTLVASADAGSVFSGWSGDCAGAGSNPVCSVLASSARSATAAFTTVPAGSQALVVRASGAGTGVVTASGGSATINCGSACTGVFLASDTVTLTATPDAGSAFLGWGGDCTGTAPTCTLRMDAARLVVPVFSLPDFALTVLRSGGGRITSSPARIDCGSICAAPFASGSTVVLTAVPDAGFIFTGWGGACSGTTVCSVLLDANRTVTAAFSATSGPVITSAALLNGKVDVPFSHTVQAAGTPAPTLAMSGTLPAGLAFSAPVLSGTPTAAGTFGLTFSASNVSGTGTQSVTLIIARGDQTITFPAVAEQSLPVAGTGALTVNPTGGASGNAVVVTSSTPAVCTAGGSDGRQVTLLAAGTCTLAANQPGNANYDAAPTVTRSFNVRASTLTFTVTPLTRTVPVGPGPVALAAADFNGDGRADLAVANLRGNNVSILTGDGQGNFTGVQSFAVGPEPTGIAVDDFNGDGIADLAVVNQGGNSVSILLGDGNGAFAAARVFQAGSVPAAVISGDFNGDGRADLAVVAQGSNSVNILLGDGRGDVGAPRNVGVGMRPQAVTAGDFNADGRTDLAVVNAGSNDVTVLLGDGAGGFRLAGALAAGSSPAAITAGDFDNDGQPDLAVLNFASHDLSLFKGSGSGTFASQRRFPTSQFPNALVKGDFDGNGALDVAIASAASANVTVLLADGAGGFSPPNPFAVGFGPFSITAGDLNGDGRGDVVVANASSDSLSLLLNTTRSTCFDDPDGDCDGDQLPNRAEGGHDGNLRLRDHNLFADNFTGRQLFVAQQYRDLLQREADIAGVRFWVSRLAAGGESRAAMVDALTRTAEFERGVLPVSRLYRLLLGRAADASGLRFWSARLAAGMSLADFADALLAQPEGARGSGGLATSAFVSLIYADLLGRPADAGGVAFWGGRIDGGSITRGAFIAALMESGEYRLLRADLDWIVTLYGALLQRTPDAGGLAFWRAELVAGRARREVIAALLASGEYRARFMSLP